MNTYDIRALRILVRIDTETIATAKNADIREFARKTLAVNTAKLAALMGAGVPA